MTSQVHIEILMAYLLPNDQLKLVKIIVCV